MEVEFKTVDDILKHYNNKDKENKNSESIEKND